MKKLFFAVLLVSITGCSTQHKINSYNSNRFGGYHGGKNIRCKHISDIETDTTQTESIYKLFLKD